MPSWLSVDALELAECIEDIPFVRRVHFFEEVDSTSLWLMRHVDSANSAAAFDGTLVVANYQSHGKGRFNRSWNAPPNKAILMSMVVCAAAAKQRFARKAIEDVERYLALIVPLAVVEGLRGETGLDVTIKYPNDAMVRGAKVGGILIQRSARFPDTYVFGIGVNVNQQAEELPHQALVASTSLTLVSKKEWDRWPLVRGILKRLAYWWETPDKAEAIQKMNELCFTVGRHVTVRLSDQVVVGLAMGISDRGGLWVRRDDGSMSEVFAGDVLELRTENSRDSA